MDANLQRGVHGEKWYGESGKATNENVPYGSFSFVLVRAGAARLHAPGHVQIRNYPAAGTGLDGSGQPVQLTWADSQAKPSIFDSF